MNLIERFISYSELVGNVNTVIAASGIEQVLGAGGSQRRYVNAPRFGMEASTLDVDEKGIDEAIVQADYGIAETGTVVIDSTDEKLRLATCLAEKLIVLVEASRVKERLEDVVDFLEERSSGENAYVAFITGASRTADIERVLTIGVHGPKEMEVIIVEDR
ncbi:MAG: LUD domain-containing protein [Deltaproteobacteria bacterium]|nr:MAG: LUD domain-containing protein [Deltaproteobacteria bacterium]